MEIKSPITGRDTILEKSIPVSEIITRYKNNFNIDVKQYFNEIEHIDIYRCTDTGYRFFYPFSVSGNSSFYEHFQQFDWYYMPWKWEHETALHYIKEQSKILEIGCAKGDFLKEVQKQKQCQCFGLEFNIEAIKSAQSKGINVSSNTNANPYIKKRFF